MRQPRPLSDKPFTVVPGELYYWTDNAPHVGLEEILDLDLVSKRTALFGQCAIDQYLNEQHRASAVLFDVHAQIQLAKPEPCKIFFPAFFLAAAERFKGYAGNSWNWPSTREFDVCCMMHKNRWPRLIASNWLYNNSRDISFTYTQHWNNQECMSALDEILQIGGLKDWTSQWGPTIGLLPPRKIDPPPYENCHWLIGRSSFLALQEKICLSSAACVVISGISWEHGCELDEKYLLAVYGGCIPVVHGFGIYERLKNIGFDVFDDIIDTSSQFDVNPVTATWNLWDRNKSFFREAKHLIVKPDIQRRLLRNLELATNLPALYQRCVTGLNGLRAQEIFDHHRHKIWPFFSNLADFERYADA